jgi:hypothetical protein
MPVGIRIHGGHYIIVFHFKYALGMAVKNVDRCPKKRRWFTHILGILQQKMVLSGTVLSNK